MVNAEAVLDRRASVRHVRFVRPIFRCTVDMPCGYTLAVVHTTAQFPGLKSKAEVELRATRPLGRHVARDQTSAQRVPAVSALT